MTIAKSQLGNGGGKSLVWYGFDSREEWCALFCQLVCGSGRTYSKGSSAKFSVCTDGVALFQAKRNGKVVEVFRHQEASSFLTGIRMEPVTM